MIAVAVDAPATPNRSTRRLLTIPKPPERLAWLRARHPYFNASAAAVLYDGHPFQSEADYAVEKLAPEPPNDPPTAPMDRGNRMEPVLLQWLADQQGVEYRTPDVLYINGQLMATLDGVPVGATDTWYEAKTFGERHDSVPRHVYWQIVAQAAATGRSQGWVVWMDPDMEFKHELVTPSRDDVEDFLVRVEEWMSWIALGMTPEGVQLGREHIAALNPNPAPGSFVELDDQGLAVIVEFEQRRQARLAAAKAEDAAKDAVARLLGDKAAAVYDGREVFTWKPTKPQTVVAWEAAARHHLTPKQLAEFTRTGVPGARRMHATKELTREMGA